MSDWTVKAWGKTRELVDSPFYSKHDLQVTVGGYCSVHYHAQRANRFMVSSGLVEVVELYGPKLVRHVLGPDNVHVVPSLVPHIFMVHKTGSMIEEYFPDRGGAVARDDIIRLTEGGMVAVTELPNLLERLLAEFGCFTTK